MSDQDVKFAIDAIRGDLARHERGHPWGVKYQDVADLLEQYDRLRARVADLERNNKELERRFFELQNLYRDTRKCTGI